MRELTVIRAERDRLIVATDSGETFALAIDDALRAEVRRASSGRGDEHEIAKPGPREIQAQIRAGLSTEEVAALLGTTVDDVRRFEGPVLAEREHMVGLALAVPVLLGAVDDTDARPSFGQAIRTKLAEASGVDERWTSWKEPTGWIVKLEFRVGEVEHDARWSFDPKRSALAPLNADATQLSRQGSLPEGLIPRLRALDSVSPYKDDSRFDSDAFGPRHEGPEADFEFPEQTPPVSPAVADAAIKRAPDSSVTSAETADLLDALRRRRGLRESAPAPEDASADADAPIALFDVTESDFGVDGETLPGEPEAPARERAESGARKRGRSALPSWDDIVFGTRGEND